MPFLINLKTNNLVIMCRSASVYGYSRRFNYHFEPVTYDQPGWLLPGAGYSVQILAIALGVNSSIPLQCAVLVQVAKLLVIPFVCLVECCWLGRVFTKPVIASVLTVVMGVAIV